MLTLIVDGELYDPEPKGRQSVLLANTKVEKIGSVDRRALDALDVPCKIIDASGCVIIPGFVDPHGHLLGGSGEGSLALQTPELLREAIDLANGGSFVDMDVVEENIAEWLPFYIDNGGPLEQLSISSDMDSSTPEVFFRQFRELVMKHRYSIDMVLPLFGANAARALELPNKGGLKVGMDADVVVLERDSLEIRDVIAGGKIMMRDGETLVREKWLEKSKRNVRFVGDEYASR